MSDCWTWCTKGLEQDATPWSAGVPDGELRVDGLTLMTVEDRAMLREACITMDRAASTASVHNAPTAFRYRATHFQRRVQANDAIGQ